MKNYWWFQKRLQGADLYTIELNYNGEFQIPDAFHVVGTEENFMWQKERLLNLLVSKLPPKYDNIAWIDADLAFANPNWAVDTEKKLKEVKACQLFDRIHWLGPDMAIERTAVGAVACKMEGIITPPGAAWAAHRDVFPLPDTHIVGGGDEIALYAWHGNKVHKFKDLMPPTWYNYHCKEVDTHYAKVRGSVGYVEGDIYHMYHGSRENRNYIARWFPLRDYDFDPDKDIGIGKNGLWKWTTDKAGMKEGVKQWFYGRREDE